MVRLHPPFAASTSSGRHRVVATDFGLSSTATKDLEQYLAAEGLRVEAALDRFLPPGSDFPSVVHEAMRYSVFAGGKRLRPLLVLSAAESIDPAAADAVLPAACAIELIHTYSLIHDDLPSMDNSDMRRGRPTCHVLFGEAVAVLAGDALHALAFQLLATPVPGVASVTSLAVVSEIASAIGTAGMVGGQVLDLLAERRPHLPAIPHWLEDGPAAVRDIHLRKTAALIRASIRVGAMLAKAPPLTLDLLTLYGERLGLAFQIIDDVLDEVGEATKLGKEARRDAVASKLTYPAVYGVEQSRVIAAQLTDEAVAAVEPLGSGGQRLAALARLLLDREA
jgi:geranylgeranyl diphosphate synthase type II